MKEGLPKRGIKETSVTVIDSSGYDAAENHPFYAFSCMTVSVFSFI